MLTVNRKVITITKGHQAQIAYKYCIRKKMRKFALHPYHINLISEMLCNEVKYSNTPFTAEDMFLQCKVLTKTRLTETVLNRYMYIL